MKDFDVTVEIFGKYKESYIIEAENAEEAKQDAIQNAINELNIISVEDMSDVDTYLSHNPYPTFKNYLINITNKKGNCSTIFNDNDLKSLINIAEKINIPNIKLIEVIGTNESIDNYKSYSVLFTRKI